MERYALKESVFEGLMKMGIDSATLSCIDRQFNEGDQSNVLIKSNIEGVKLNMWRHEVCEIVEVEESEVGAVILAKEVQKKISFDDKLFYVLMTIGACGFINWFFKDVVK